MKKSNRFSFKNFTFDFKNKTEYPKWISFYPKIDEPQISLESNGYFDPRPQLTFTLTFVFAIIGTILTIYYGYGWFALLFVPLYIWGWGAVFINLPYDSGVDDCESVWEYQIQMCFRDGTYIPDLIWVVWGKNYSKFFSIPFLTLEWYSTRYLLQNNNWGISGGEYKSQFEIWDENINQTKYKETFPFTYNSKYHGGQETTAECSLEIREWRRYGLRWTSFGNFVRPSLRIEFGKEIGDKVSSWKGGVVGTSCEINYPKETFQQALMKFQEKTNKEQRW